MRDWARGSLPGVFFALLIAPFGSTEIANETARPTPSLGLAVRKDPGPEEHDTNVGPLRTLGTLINMHTGEALVLSEQEPALSSFARLTEDRVTGSGVSMDPALLGLLRSLAQGQAPVRIEIVSGYRSWKLNEYLRKKGRRVASHSQHSLGRAIDFRIEGKTTSQLREAIEKAGWRGGIGYYPKASDRFVHADTGPNRHWVGH